MGKARVANRTRENRPSGMKRGGLWKRELWWNYDPAAQTERVRVGNSLPIGCARRISIPSAGGGGEPAFLPREASWSPNRYMCFGNYRNSIRIKQTFRSAKLVMYSKITK